MSKSDKRFGIIFITCGALVVFVGLMGVAFPHSLADVVVPLARNSPADEVYTIVGGHIDKAMRFYYTIVIVLGLVILTTAWFAFFRQRD